MTRTTLLVLLGMGSGLLLATPLQAQALPDYFVACYVPVTGTVYRIAEGSLPGACTDPSHVQFRWGSLELADSAPAPGQVLTWEPNQGVWKPLNVETLQGRRVCANAPSTGVNTDVLSWDAESQCWRPQPSVLAEYLRGAGTSESAFPIAATPPSAGQVLTFTGSEWKPTTPTSGGGTSDHGALTGLLDDDHPQYLLANGVRATTNGFAVTGTQNIGTIPASGPGTRLMWYPRKAAFRAGAADNQWDDAFIGRWSVAMGAFTTASGDAATALGASTTASGRGATAIGRATLASGEASVAIGLAVTASERSALALGSASVASGLNSTAIGTSTVASGASSTAIGSYASTNSQQGSFIYGDFSITPGTAGAVVNATAANSFVVRAQRVWFGRSGNQVATSGRYLETSTGGYLSNGGTWVNASDVNRKENFRAEDPAEVLRRLAAIPIQSWNYRDEDDSVRHLGPTAQDFRAAFGLGQDERGISTVDEGGVALAAIQALERRMREQAREIAELRAELEKLRGH